MNTNCIKAFILLLGVLFAFSITAIGQNQRAKKDTSYESLGRYKPFSYGWRLGIKVEGHVGEGGLGLMLCNWNNQDLAGMPNIAISNVMVDGGNFINPKLSAEYTFLFLAVRLSATEYTLGTPELRICPEFGFSLLGFVNVMYGQDLFPNKERDIGLSTFGWSIEFNLPFHMKS